MSNKQTLENCPKCSFGIINGEGCDTCDYVEFDVDNMFGDDDVDFDVADLFGDDVVNNPSHYGNGQIECIDYMKDNMAPEMFMGFLEGNTKKYLHRFRHKGKPVEDLRKARWYLDRLIQEYEG